MSPALTTFLGCVALTALMFWLVTRIRYVTDDRYVRVVLLGVTLRRIALSNIESVDTAAPFWNEHWCNTLIARHRVVCLHRKRGWIRAFIITPVNRDEFIADLRARVAVPPS